MPAPANRQTHMSSQNDLILDHNVTQDNEVTMTAYPNCSGTRAPFSTALSVSVWYFFSRPGVYPFLSGIKIICVLAVSSKRIQMPPTEQEGTSQSMFLSHKLMNMIASSMEVFQTS